MAEVGFVHLRVHSSYSLLEGALPIPRLVDLAKADRQPALGLADTSNLFGALEFSDKAVGAGIQPIIGCQLGVDFADAVLQPRSSLPRKRPAVVLLAATVEGYGRLVRLASHAFLDIDGTDEPHVTLARLGELSDGLVLLSGGPCGPIAEALRARGEGAARERLERLASAFGDRLYVELQRHGLPEEAESEPALLALADRLGLPIVATNEPFFAAAEDHEAHDALLAIAQGALVTDDGRRRLSPEHRFKTRAEMAALFADLPDALAATVEIARRCSFRPEKRKPILPRFVGAEAGDAAAAATLEASELRRQAEEGLARRLVAAPPAPGLERADYERRLAFELSVIERMRYCGYFLIVADFIQWAKSKGIPVGPGRGSGAGSVVAWSLTITDLDPLRFGLLFERFLNPERVSMPDFDIDFCQDRRDEVIAYVQARYGASRVAQIITFGTLQARAVLRDVGRVLQMPYGQVDRLAKLVPHNPAHPVSLGAAIEGEPRLKEARDGDPLVARLLGIALKLEGLYRHASTHAAGIVIGDRPLHELVPLYRDPRSGMPVTQFNMKWVENAGLVKFDFLGLKTLTVLDKAVALLERRGIALDLAGLPLDDPKTYEFLARGETVGVFQLESQGMRKAIADIRPDRFEDIIALVALYRPGPMASIPVYGARKHGLEKPEVLHPSMTEVLAETFGIIVYQEQVMEIARLLAGYSLGEADLLRRAMGKKIKAEMEAQRSRFVGGAAERGVARVQGEAIFDLLAKFADYGFNKSHAAAYALIAYQTAYLKANFPVEFLAASMTLDLGNTDKLADFRREALRLGITVEPPSIGRSGVEFEVVEGCIVYALAAVKGVGQQAAAHIVAARGAAHFRDLADFARRVSPRQANKRALECLVAAGAFDALEPNRARLAAGLDVVLAAASRAENDKDIGQSDIFAASARGTEIRLPEIDPWTPADRLQREHDAVGFYLSAHPLDGYRPILPKLRVQLWTEFADAVRRGATHGRLVGAVTSRQERRTKSGSKMGIVQLSDPSGHYEAILFSEGLLAYRELLETGAAVVLFVSAEERAEGVSVRVESVERLEEAAAKIQNRLRVFLRDATALDRLAKQLDAPGEGEVSLVLRQQEREIEMRLSGRYRVSPQVASALQALPGVIEVELA